MSHRTLNTVVTPEYIKQRGLFQQLILLPFPPAFSPPSSYGRHPTFLSYPSARPTSFVPRLTYAVFFLLLFLSKPHFPLLPLVALVYFSIYTSSIPFQLSPLPLPRFYCIFLTSQSPSLFSIVFYSLPSPPPISTPPPWVLRWVKWTWWYRLYTEPLIALWPSRS